MFALEHREELSGKLTCQCVATKTSYYCKAQSTASPGALETNSNQELYGSVKGAALGSTSLESRGVLTPRLDDPIRR